MADNRRNYYRILHVQPDAPVEVIRSSYRTMMQRLRMHPDLGGDHATATLVNEAYAVLIDPEKRAAYDEQLDRHRREPPPAGTARPKTGKARRPGQRRPDMTAGGTEHCAFCNTGYHRRMDDPEATCSHCGSPLARPPAGSSANGWLRTIERFPRDQVVNWWLDWPAPAGEGRLIDLSLTGLRMIVAQPIPRDRFIKLECPMFQAVARVIHCQQAVSGAPGHWQIGAAFFALRFARSRGGFVSDEA